MNFAILNTENGFVQYIARDVTSKEAALASFDAHVGITPQESDALDVADWRFVELTDAQADHVEEMDGTRGDAIEYVEAIADEA